MQHEEINLIAFSDRLQAPEEAVGYRVCDPLGQKIGEAEEIFVNEDMEPQYVRVKVGLFGTKSVLIPVVSVSVDEERQAITLQ
jgi:PRC-barrel domain